MIRGVGDSPYHWCGELTTLSIIDTESFLFKKSIADSPTPRIIDTQTPHIGDSGELFFEYEYFGEFEAKIGTPQKVV
jgi:hypothetical protein